MSSSQLTHFDVNTIEEINAELISRKIELMNVVNVESIKITIPAPEDRIDDEYEADGFRVWYWYISELIAL